MWSPQASEAHLAAGLPGKPAGGWGPALWHPAGPWHLYVALGRPREPLLSQLIALPRQAIANSLQVSGAASLSPSSSSRTQDAAATAHQLSMVLVEKQEPAVKILPGMNTDPSCLHVTGQSSSPAGLGGTGSSSGVGDGSSPQWMLSVPPGMAFRARAFGQSWGCPGGRVLLPAPRSCFLPPGAQSLGEVQP